MIADPHYFLTECDDLGYGNQLLLGRYHFSHARRHLPPHTHPGRIEICYLASGMQVYEVAARRYVLKGNDLYLTFPDEPHDTGGFPQEKGVLFWMQVGVPTAEARFLCYDAAEVLPLFRRLLAAPRRCFQGSRRVQALFEETLAAYLHDDADLRRLTVATGVVRLLREVLACAERTPEAKPPSHDINAVIEYIEGHLDAPLAVPALADEMGLSVSHFKARFKYEVGIPPAEYVLRRKIERAKALLHGPDASVTAIAYLLGFSSSQYFATVFKRFTGLRPSEFARPRGG